MRFSIITTAYIWNEYRAERLQECIRSITEQVYDHSSFEHIIVNDGSTIEVDIPKYPWIKVVNQPNKGRIEAFSTGFRHAKGEIFCLLDSDDEYVDNYLGIVDWLYLSNPKVKMFNFGNYFHHKDGKITRRDAFKPKRKKVGHEMFGGGNIVNGTFVFHRKIYDEMGAFPPLVVKNVDCTPLNYPQYKNQKKPYIRDLYTASPYDWSAIAQTEFPEIQKYFMVKHPDHPELLVKELGNPFGNDYYLFYKYTRKYHSKPIDKYLLKVFLR